MLDINVDKVSEIIKEVAEQEIIPRYQNLQEGDVSTKSAPDDFVTVADVNSEKALTAKLLELLPDSLVVGEEVVSKDISVLENFKQDKPVWVLDPIDGTRNFVTGKGRFGVLVALVQNNETLYGWLYDVVNKKMITVKKGEGVYLDGVKLEADLNQSEELSDMRFSCWSKFFKNEDAEESFSVFKSVDEMGMSIEFYHDVATGGYDIIAGAGWINCWDHLAGFLALKELGYCVLMGDKKELTPDFRGKAFMLCAPNKKVWDKAYELVYPFAKEYL